MHALALALRYAEHMLVVREGRAGRHGRVDPAVRVRSEPTSAAVGMRRVLVLVAGPRLAPPEDHRRRTWPALLSSLALHAMVLGCVVAWTIFWWHRLPEPTEPPTVDVVVDGGGAAVTGVAAARPTPPSAPPAAQPRAPVPEPQTPASATAPPEPAQPPPQDEPPSPPLPQVAGLAPLPPAAPVPATAPPPQPEPPPAAEIPSPAQTASQTPPPTPHSEAAPEIRLGNGASGPFAEIDDEGIVRRAKASDGNIPPTYPLDAARRGEHGTVTLRLTIGTGGEVLEAEVAKSSGSPRLDRAAREQIATWHFTPAMQDGKPQIDVIELGVDFRLD